MKKIAVISETIFCDSESNFSVLDVYFERLVKCLHSIANLDISGFDYRHILYISGDKSTHIEKIQNLNFAGLGDRLVVIKYEHPEEGYNLPGDHIDLIKNPNRSPGYRDKLFAMVGLDFEDYDFIIRIAIDDDDLWLPWHIKNIVEYVGDKYFNVEYSEKFIHGIGILNSYIAYVASDKCIVEKVELNRFICGNKFYVSNDWGWISKWSPWSFPDLVDDAVVLKFRSRHGIQLNSLSTNDPGFIYVRRGSNLSVQNKDWCVSKKDDVITISGEDELLSLPRRFICEGLREINTEDVSLLNIEFRDSKIFYRLKFNKGDKNKKFAFYLYGDGVAVNKKFYSNFSEGFFDYFVANGDFVVVGFVRDEFGKIERVRSKMLRVTRGGAEVGGASFSAEIAAHQERGSSTEILTSKVLNVKLESKDSKKWVAKIVGCEAFPAHEYAFYLMRSGERVATRWYSNEAVAEFEIPVASGDYYAIGFARPDSLSSPVFHKSNIICHK